MEYKIDIAIFGNPLRKEGASLIGCTPSSSLKMEYAGLSGISAAPFAVEVKVYPNFTSYILVCNNVTTSDGEKGTLNVGVGIPADTRLVGDKTPLDLLFYVLEKFRSVYMQPSFGSLVPGSYTYKSMVVVPDEFFQDFLRQYSLEPAPAPYYPMTGSGKCAIRLSVDEMKCFTRDVSRYSNLAKYASVVIAEVIDASNYADNQTGLLEIPLKRRFKIVASGSEKIIENLDDTITVYSQEDGRYYDRQVCKFTINELLAGKPVPGVKLDTKTDTVTCNLRGQAKQIAYKVRFNRPANCKVSDAACLSALTLTLDNSFVDLKGDTFYLVGEDNKRLQQIKVDFSCPGYRINGTTFNNEVLEISIVDVQPVKLDDVSGARTLNIKVTSSDPNETYWFRIEKEDRYLFEGVLKLAVPVAAKSKKEKVATVVLPDIIETETFSLSLHTAKKSTLPKSFSYRPNAKEVSFDVANMKPISGLGGLYGKICAFLAPILLCAAIFFGYMWLNSEPKVRVVEKAKAVDESRTSESGGTRSGNQGNDNSKSGGQENPVGKDAVNGGSAGRDAAGDGSGAQNKTNTPSGGTTGNRQKKPEKQQKPEIDENEIKEFFENVVVTLKKDALTFEEVKRLYAEYAGKSDEWKKAAKKLQLQDVSQLEAYKTVVDVLTLHPGINYYNDPDGDKFGELYDKITELDVDNATLKKLNNAHREDVLGIYWGFYKKGKFVEYRYDNAKVNGRDRQGQADGLIFFINNREKKFVDFEALDKMRNARAVPLQ